MDSQKAIVSSTAVAVRHAETLGGSLPSGGIPSGESHAAPSGRLATRVLHCPDHVEQPAADASRRPPLQQTKVAIMGTKGKHPELGPSAALHRDPSLCLPARSASP